MAKLAWAGTIAAGLFVVGIIGALTVSLQPSNEKALWDHEGNPPAAKHCTIWRC